MRPTHRPNNARHSHDGTNTNNPNAPEQRGIPITNRRFRARVAAGFASLKRAVGPLPKLIDARLLVTFVAIALVAIILTATAYMQNPQSVQQETEPVKSISQKDARSISDNTVKERRETVLATTEPRAPQVASNYSFTTAVNASLTDMSAGTTSLVAADQDDTASAVTTIGFDFYFQGVRFTQFSANSNGLMRLGSTAVQASSPYKPLAQASIPLITPYGADQRTLITSGKVHFKVIGAAPNRVLIVEWLNMQSNFSSGGTLDLSYQARCYETTGVIEFVYGTASMSAAGAANVNSRDPNVGFSSSNTAGTVGSVTAAQSGTPAPTFDGSSATAAANLYTAGTIPVLNSVANGSRRIFTFSPPTPTAPTNITFTSVAPSSYTVNWTDSANETLYAIFRSTDGTNYTFQNTAAQNVTTFAATGLAPSTTYFWQVYAVSEGALSSALAGSQASAPAGNITSTTTGGLWSATTTWAGGVVPTASDNVTIANGATVTIDTAANAFNLTVGQGTSGILQYETTTARTLTVVNDVTIAVGGTYKTGAVGTVTTHALSLGGNLTNNGTLDFSTTGTSANSCGANITFTGATDASATLNAGSSTDFRQTTGITLNKGTSSTPVFTFTPGGTITVLGANAVGFLNITNGTFKLSGANAFSNPVFNATGYSIPATGGFWLNNANASVVGLAGSPTNNGTLRVTNGTYNIGTSSGNSMGAGVGAVFTIEGGTVNVAGRLQTGNAVTYNQSAGTVNVSTVGNASSTTASFGLGNSSSFIMSGGTINLVQINSTGTATNRLDWAVFGTATYTGGTLNFGTSATTGNAGDFTFRMRGLVPAFTIDNTTNAKKVSLITGQANVFGNITLNTGTSLDCNGLLLLFLGSAITNNGAILETVASSEFDFAGSSAQTYGGTGTFGTNAVPLAGFGVDIANSSGVTLNAPIVTSRVNLIVGTFTNSNQITIGTGGASSSVIQVGGGGAAIPAGTFDIAPAFNIGSAGLTNRYDSATATTTGNEIPAGRSLASLIMNNANGLTLAGGNLTVTGTATFTTGNVTTNANTLIIGSAGTLTRTSGHVIGNLQKTFTAISSKTFEVGTANGYSPVAVNGTAGTFPANFTTSATQGSMPGITGANKLARYWTLTSPGVLTANLTFTYLNTDPIGTVANYQFIKKATGGALSILAPTGTPTSTSATINGVSSFSDWTLAEATAVQSGSLQFSSPTYSVSESGPTISVDVTRIGGTDGLVGISYTTNNGTATSGTDYTTTAGTLSWGAGISANQTITIPITDDAVFEGNEDFTVTLSSPTGGATLGSPSSATVTINDNDTAPTLAINDVSQSEGNAGTTNYTFTVTKTGATASNVTVDYATADGTATAPTDYTAISTTTLTFLPSDTTKQFIVSVNGDVTVEPTELFYVNLTNASGATISDSQGTGTILTDDAGANGGKIAFASDRDGNYEIYAMNADGTSQTRLTINPADDQAPVFSNDGSKIVFHTNRDGNYEIYSMNANGTGLTRLTNNAAGDILPVFSADGTRIAFTSDRDGNKEVYVMNADGTSPVNLTNSPGIDSSPAFSPDGSKLAFTSRRDGQYEIYVMNADGTNQTNLTFNSAADTEPTYSPDGTKIAFITVRDGNNEIYSMNANGSSPTNLTNNAAGSVGDIVPAYSPDGSKIAFASDRSGNTEVYVMNANGSGQINISNSSTTDIDPSWAVGNVSPGTIQFDSATYSVNEGAGTVTLNVTRTGGTDGAVGFSYATASGTATSVAGADFLSQTGGGSFASGSAVNQTITITITDDSLYESNEDFTVTLTGTSGGATLGSPAVATVTITDNDTAPTISIDNVTVAESGGNAVFTVTQSAITAVTTTFTYSTADGTATAPADYTAATNAPGSITAGNTTTTISIPIIQDAIDDDGETFTVTLSNPVNATIVTGTGTATITDDDVTFNADGNLPAGTYDNITINGPCPTSNYVHLTGNVIINGAFTVNDCGNLYTDGFTVSGPGSFVLNAQGWLHLTDANGITNNACGTGPSCGNIRTSTRTFDTGANYDYDGNVNQAVGNGLPSPVNYLLIANSGTSPNNVVTGNANQAVTAELNVITGVYVSSSDYNDVVIQPAGTLSLANNITVSGNWTNNGTFNANGFGVTFDGNTAQSISGSTATAFAAFTISNTGNVVTLNQNASDTSLAVTSGTFSQAGSSDLTSGAATVSSGATWNNFGTGDLTLSGDVSNAGTISFNANGTGCGDADSILIRSSVDPTQRIWSGAGSFNMTDVDVRSQRTPLVPPPVAISVTSGTDSGNNTGWVFTGTCIAGTYTWIGGINGDWQVPTNWSPTRAVPAAGDILYIDGSITPGPTLTNVPTQTIAALRLINGTVPATLIASAVAPPQTLTVSGATGQDLSVPSGNQLVIAGTDGLTINVASSSTAIIGGLFIMQDGPHRLIGNAANAITFQSGSICTLAPSYASTVNPFGTGGGGVNGATGSVIFEVSSNYFHNNGESPFGAVANPPVAVFQTGSVAKWYSNNGFQGRTYSSLIIGDGTTPIVISSSGTDPFEFDSLTVNSTNTANTSLTVSTGGNVNIKGDIFSTGNGNLAAVADVTLLSSTNIVIAKTSAGTINFSNDVGSNRTVNFGNATPGSGNATVVTGNTLALTRKLIVDTGSVITVNGALIGSATGYVIGKEKRPYTGAELFVYHVGTTNAYSPLDANVTAGSGDLTTEAKTPNQPLLNPATSLQRYWTLTEGGAITADLTFHYNDPLDIAGNENNYGLIVVESGNATSFPNNCPSVCVNPAANTITKQGVIDFSDWTAGEPNAPTAVKLTGFAATQNGNEVTLQWQSGYEARNLGYNIYREQEGKRVAITPSLVAGSALIAGRQTKLTAGLNYTWYDDLNQRSEVGGQSLGTQDLELRNQNSPVTYWLEDVDINGTRTLHGPIAPTITYGKATRGELRAGLLSDVSRRTGSSGVQFNSWPSDSGESQAAADSTQAAQPNIENASAGAPIDVQRQIAGMPGVKIAVSRSGWYRITQPQLIAAGLDPNVDSSRLQLYAEGRPVAIKQSGRGATFNSSDYIEFYGHGLTSTTDAAQTYYLVVNDSPGSRVRDYAENKARTTGPAGPASFPYTVERKERMIYFSGLLNGDGENFFGQVVSGTPASANVPISNLDRATIAAGTPAQLEVTLQGVTNQSHLVQVLFNGADIGTLNFANTEHPVQTLIVPAGALREGNNVVRLTSLGGPADVNLVDTLRLTYAHSFVADGNRFSLNIDNSASRRVDGFTTNNIRVVDLSDPQGVTELTESATVKAKLDGTYSVFVQLGKMKSNHPHTLVMFADDLALPADSVKQTNPSSWWSETAGADYLIISTHELAASVEPLAQLRRNQGMIVKVVDVEDLYDEFSFGEHSPQAVRAFLETAANNWTRKPHYLLLAGDASFDPKNYAGLGHNDLVPTKLVDTTLTESASDDWLADFNGDGIADLAIGRLPVRTVAETDALVSKIVNYENAAPDPSRGALLVADTSFEAPSSSVQSLLPAGMAVQTINRSSADDATIRNRILTSINQGPLITNFVGHGSNGVWTGASLLSSLDAPALTNTNRLSVFTLMTCFNGYFQDAYNDSLSEALLKSPGGAVAVWASSTLTEPAGQNAIDQQFYRLLFGAQPATLGDAARAAKVVTNDADVRRTWTLLGDPAMRPR